MGEGLSENVEKVAQPLGERIGGDEDSRFEQPFHINQGRTEVRKRAGARVVAIFRRRKHSHVDHGEEGHRLSLDQGRLA